MTKTLLRIRPLQLIALVAFSLSSEVVRAEIFSGGSTFYQPTIVWRYFYILPGQRPVFCQEGDACQSDGNWTQQNYPSLGIDERFSVTPGTGEASAFYLGNSLNGLYRASLTALHASELNTGEPDSLGVSIANRTAIFANMSASNGGELVFSAVKGNDYYLFLGGGVRADHFYELKLTQVPLPASIVLFASVMGGFWGRRFLAGRVGLAK